MRYTQNINQVKCIDWGLNLAQGALFDLLNQMHSWAGHCVIDGEVYYWVSRNKVIEEIPLAYEKPDTVYRAFKTLARKGLIKYKKEGQKDLIQLTEKGKTWNAKINKGDAKNSEINPNKDGNKSETCQELGNESDQTRKYIREDSDLNPTYKDTSNNNYKDNKKNKQKKSESDDAKILLDFWNQNAKQDLKIRTWRSKLEARLKNLSTEEIKQAMLGVIKSSWHKQNGQINIDLAISSDQRSEKSIERYKQLQTSGNKNANPVSTVTRNNADQYYQQQMDKCNSDGFGQPSQLVDVT